MADPIARAAAPAAPAVTAGLPRREPGPGGAPTAPSPASPATAPPTARVQAAAPDPSGVSGSLIDVFA